MAADTAMPRRRSLLVPGSAFSQCWLDTQNLFPQLCLPSYLFLTRWCENIIKAHGKKKIKEAEKVVLQMIFRSLGSPVL